MDAIESILIIKFPHYSLNDCSNQLHDSNDIDNDEILILIFELVSYLIQNYPNCEFETKNFSKLLDTIKLYPIFSKKQINYFLNLYDQILKTQIILDTDKLKLILKWVDALRKFPDYNNSKMLKYFDVLIEYFDESFGKVDEREFPPIVCQNQIDVGNIIKVLTDKFNYNKIFPLIWKKVFFYLKQVI